MASLMTNSPVPKKATVLELIDNLVEVRFRVMPSAGKTKILYFDKPYWYNHKDPLDLEIESNADIFSSKHPSLDTSRNIKNTIQKIAYIPGHLFISKLFGKLKCVYIIFMLFK